jgi:ligand-binding SRPBCC domain-containing protein
MCFARPVAEVFGFFVQTANVILLTPPELHLRVVEGPERLSLGARVTLKARRWGIPQQAVSEVTRFEPDTIFVESQLTGPFRRWVHTHSFEQAGAGTRVRDVIDFEPPGGLLGLVVTAGLLAKDLEWVFAHREKKLRELLGN